MKRQCYKCRRLIEGGQRCKPCERERSRARGTPAQQGYPPSWQRFSRQLRQQQPWCERCGSGSNLTVDHVVPHSSAGGFRVLCRSCHSSIGARRDRSQTHWSRP